MASSTVISDGIITWNFEIVFFLLRNVLFSAITSITFFFRYNSSSLRFGLIPLQFQKQNACTHKIGQRIPVVVESVLRWPMIGGTYLEVIGCLGAALADLLCGEMDFNTVDGFGIVLETVLTLVLVNVEGLGKTGMLRELMDLNRSFPVMSTLSIVLTAFEIFGYMPDLACPVLDLGSKPVVGIFV